MRKIKDEILDILEIDPLSRDSDIRLTNQLWIKYYNSKLLQDGSGYYVKLQTLYELPSQDDVKRIRAKIQNEEHKFLPTTWEVAKQRKIKEEVWRSFLGYNNPARG